MLYEVTRTDEIGPGEFVNAIVVASGTNQACGAVAHMSGVTPNGGNLRARKVDTTRRIEVLSVYHDERDDYGTDSAVFTDGFNPFT